MPNEAEQELIASVMTSDWLGCVLPGRGKGSEWLTVEQGGQRREQGDTPRVTEQRKPGDLFSCKPSGTSLRNLARFSSEV